MRLSAFALLFASVGLLPGCDRRTESVPLPARPADAEPARPVPPQARLEDAPFAKGPRMADAFSIKGPAFDLVYDPYRERVYASLNGEEVGVVARIKPDSGELDGEVRLAGEVGPMALAPDGSNLWVVVHTAQAPQLCRIDLKTMKADEPKALQPSPDNWPAPDALVMVPGTSNSFVAAYVGYKNVVVYDAVKVRPEQVGGKVCAGLAYAGEGATFFAYNNADTGWQLYELLVTDNGVRLVQEHLGVIDSFRVGISAGAGRIYASNGCVFDVKAKKTIGRLPGGGDVAIDPLNRRAYQVRHEPYVGDQVTVFDWDSFEPRASYLARQTIPFRDTAKLPLTMTAGLPVGRRYLGKTCKPVLMLGESGLVINREHVLTFLPTAVILKAEPK
jgi:hypothetical protein